MGGKHVKLLMFMEEQESCLEMATVGLDNKNVWAEKTNYKNRENKGLRLKEKKKKPGFSSTQLLRSSSRLLLEHFLN